MNEKGKKISNLVLISCIATIAFDCAMTGFFEYDKIFDSYTTDIGKKYEMFLSQMETQGNEASAVQVYEKNIQFYQEVYATVGLLKLRESARVKKANVMAALEQIEKMTREMESLHKAENRLKPDYIKSQRELLHKQLTILFTEERKRMYEESGKRRN